MDETKVWSLMAGMLKDCDPPDLDVGSLGGKHANFARINGDSHVLIQAKWRRPHLRVGVALDHGEPEVNRDRADVLEDLFRGELAAGLFEHTHGDTVHYFTRDLTLARYENEEELAADAAVVLLLCIGRLHGAPSLSPASPV